MNTIEAVYQDGVFKPVGDVALRENQRVRLSIQPVEPTEILDWLRRAQALRQQILERRGPFPDSTPEIAEDRLRDV
jgi:predicted DNA-binding antitoxin AbrB/MazE fold protein